MRRRLAPLAVLLLLSTTACDAGGDAKPDGAKAAADDAKPTPGDAKPEAKPAKPKPATADPKAGATDPTPDAADPKAAAATDKPNSGWACTCLKEKVDGEAQDETACRPKMLDCGKLQRRVGFGSKTMVRGSVGEGKGCRYIGESEHPGDLLGGQEGWAPSAKAGSFVLRGKCVLPDDPTSTAKLAYEVGPLKQGMKAAEVEKALGAPDKKGEIFEEGATGDWVQDWTWTGKGVVVGMAAAKKDGPQAVSTITVSPPNDFKTPLGIGVGDEYAKAVATYARHEASKDEGGGAGGDQFIAGSIYGGVFFTKGKDGKVESIFVGAGAE